MDNSLTHYGIKGQKWGVRRFQNKDGSRTAAGKARAKKASEMSNDELKEAISRRTLERSYNKLYKTESQLEKGKRVVDASSQLVNTAKQIERETRKTSSKKMDLSNMTDQQLRDQINRANLERQYQDLFGKDAEQVSKGRAFAQQALEIGGGVLTVTGSALAIAVAIKELRKP